MKTAMDVVKGKIVDIDENGVPLDRTLCKIYGLKKKQPEMEEEINERNC